MCVVCVFMFHVSCVMCPSKPQAECACVCVHNLLTITIQTAWFPLSAPHMHSLGQLILSTHTHHDLTWQGGHARTHTHTHMHTH